MDRKVLDRVYDGDRSVEKCKRESSYNMGKGRTLSLHSKYHDSQLKPSVI